MNRLDARLEELERRRVEADRDDTGNFHDQASSRGRSPPPLARRVAMPRAVQPEMAPQLEPRVEPDEEVLAVRLALGDRPPDKPVRLRARQSCASRRDR